MPANKVIGTDILTGTGNRHLVNLISDKSKDDQTPSLNMQIHQKVSVSYTHLTLPTNREV